MKSWATFFIFALCALFTVEAAAAERVNKILIPKLLTEAPHIDGVIDPLWSTVDSVSDFFQLQPYFNQPPSHPTVAKVFTTRDALYCMMICYDDRSNIQNVTGTLDNTTGDIASIMLDTFGDQRTAYKLAVTASGVRADCRLLDDARDRDYNWDGIWKAASKIYDWGFVIEWEIPYRSLQYGKNLTAWGLDFDRWSPKRGEDLYWDNYAQNEGQRISKFGRLQFQDFYPSTEGLNLEVYPVGITKTTRQADGSSKSQASAGLDMFYNPSEQLTFQLSANPDFAQIEADPFSFNISQYETHYNERRPFFTQGNEIFMAAGRERNSGFYRPLELFYSRRIGQKLPDGTEVPLIVGTKAFGRAGDWEYGGLLSVTGEQDFVSNGVTQTESRAQFGVARIKKQVFGNSSIGALMVGKKSDGQDNAVIDLDGAFRTSELQLSWQVARSSTNGVGGYAVSAGLTGRGKNWLNLFRVRSVQTDFNVDEVGYVPWKGTTNFVGLSGPHWYFDNGAVSEFTIGIGPAFNRKEYEGFTDYYLNGFFNAQFRANWGCELDYGIGRAKDLGIEYPSASLDFSSWYNISPAWSGGLYGGWQKSYNFRRSYLGTNSYTGSDIDWRATKSFTLGTSVSAYIENDPTGSVEDITYNARPYCSLTPFNDLSIRLYVDNLFTRSSDQMQQVIAGFLVSYNFMPKSWIYLALNDVHDRSPEFDPAGNLLSNRMHVTAQAAVLKAKYLYYF